MHYLWMITYCFSSNFLFQSRSTVANSTASKPAVFFQYAKGAVVGAVTVKQKTLQQHWEDWFIAALTPALTPFSLCLYIAFEFVGFSPDSRWMSNPNSDMTDEALLGSCDTKHMAAHLFLQVNGPVENSCAETNSLSVPLVGAKVMDAGAFFIYILDMSRTRACCAYKRNNMGWQILLCRTGIRNIWMGRSFHYVVHPFSCLSYLPTFPFSHTSLLEKCRNDCIF